MPVSIGQAEIPMPLGAYVHVPFCLSRCGYCDFNTYTATELQRDGTTVSVVNYREYAQQEIRWSAQQMTHIRPISTVFFGGGTPTVLAAQDLVSLLQELKDTYGLTLDAEVTTEANPDSVDLDYLMTLHAGGFTRISFGHQSSAPKVLNYLERTHTSGRTWQAVQWAKEAGFQHISVDLIYGSPVETDEDLAATLREVIAADVDHVSAYSLIVETGTKLAHNITRGVVEAPSDDVAADRYSIIDRELTQAGFAWYEVSNWARDGGECRHNLGYWRSHDWLGIGPGAHAYTDSVRSWNIKHPAAWAAALDSGRGPRLDCESITQAQAVREHIMLGLRLREGLSRTHLSESALSQAQIAIAEGFLELSNDRYVLTDYGRLWADALVARLWD